MSTRSIIAIPDGDAWKGRYCHSDGYPEWMGRVLWNEVRAAGAPAFAAFIADDGPGRVGCSCLYLRFLTAPAEQDWEAAFALGDSTNYRVYFGRAGEPQVDPWRVPGDYEEYLYIVGDAALFAFDTHGTAPRSLGVFRYDQAEPDWARVECGEHFEHCTHVDGYHDRATA